MARLRKKLGAALIGAVALSLSLTACGGDSGGSDAGSSDEIDTANASGEISYWLWDANQKPAYQKCADDFTKANPNIKVNISQYGWDDYWTKVTNGFVAGTAPDVFTDHLAKYPEFVTNEQLVALDDVLAANNFDTAKYQKGLAELWTGQDGKRYGLPKDFDTIGLFYNKKMATDAGLDTAALGELAWNPTDGGTYEKAIARMTVDSNGKRGDEAGFDKTKVKVYGLAFDGAGSGVGQTQWSMYTGSNNWTHTDKNPWGTKYNYDKPEFQNTIKWWYGMMEKGYMPSLASTTGQSAADLFSAGKYAMVMNGDWLTNQFFGYKDVEVGIAPTPIGPTGKRASMYNGLADSIWVGSKNKGAAAKWVMYLGSAECQDVVGEAGVVFPAIPSGTAKAEAAFKSKDIDVSPFTNHVKDGTTFLFPITDNASKIEGIMQPAMDAVMSGKADVSSLTQANEEVNALFG